MSEVQALGDAHFNSVRGFLLAFDAGDALGAAGWFSVDAAVFEVDHDGFGQMVSAVASARGRVNIANWLMQFIVAGVRIHPTVRRDFQGSMEVEAEWSMLGPGGEVVVSQTLGRYTFDALQIRHLIVVSDITA